MMTGYVLKFSVPMVRDCNVPRAGVDCIHGRDRVGHIVDCDLAGARLETRHPVKRHVQRRVVAHVRRAVGGVSAAIIVELTVRVALLLVTDPAALETLTL